MNLTYTEIRKRCLKPDESEKPLYARHITHTFSTGFVWLFQNAPLKPNHLTLLSLILAFAALPFFAGMTGVSVLIGTLLIELYYIFDAVDGQWARLKNMRSITGAFFDYLINYALQPPLLFSIGWGVFSQTSNPIYLLFGFTAAFSTLWVILIWNIRASVLLPHVLKKSGSSAARVGTPESSETTKKGSLPRFLFGWLHKSLVFPWFMYVLTLTSIACFIAECVFSDTYFTQNAFMLFLFYYGVLGPVIAVVLTTQWILTKKLDRAPELYS